MQLINKIVNKLKKDFNIITGAGEYLFVSSHSIESSKSIAIGLLYGFSLSLIGLIECSDGRLNGWGFDIGRLETLVSRLIGRISSIGLSPYIYNNHIVNYNIKNDIAFEKIYF